MVYGSSKFAYFRLHDSMLKILTEANVNDVRCLVILTMENTHLVLMGQMIMLILNTYTDLLGANEIENVQNIGEDLICPLKMAF